MSITATKTFNNLVKLILITKQEMNTTVKVLQYLKFLNLTSNRS